MCNNDYILYVIERLKEINPDTPPDGYFQSTTDRAYRLEAIRQIFCGLEQKNQDEVLRYAMEKLVRKNPCIAEKATYIARAI